MRRIGIDTFAFIIHPIDPKRDVQRKFPLLGKILPVPAIHFLSRFFPPIYLSEINGIQSTSTHETIKGWFIACPLTPQAMLTLPPEFVYRKIIETGRMAERLGANILGLGAFTSVIGDGGITISKALDIPVTTGDSYTVATAMAAVREAARVMGIDLPRATGAVVGATGTIGRVCAELLSREVGQILLLGRRNEALNQVKSGLESLSLAQVSTSTDLQTLRQADVVIAVSSAVDSLIQPDHLKPGAVICDVARPRDVSKQVIQTRPDVLVIEGGMVEVPGHVNFNFNFGFPPQMAYACMAETMVLTLEKRFEPFSLGKAISVNQVETIDRLAIQHGFQLGGFRSFERAVTPGDIQAVKAHL